MLIRPDGAVGEDTNSQAELARGRTDRNRQLPARFRDCETDSHPRKSRQHDSLLDRGSRRCGDGPGKPSGPLGTDHMGKDHLHYLRLSIMTAWQKSNEYYTKLGDSPLFAASIILHPSLGLNYLEVNWASEEQLVWVRDAKIGLSDYLDRWYCCNQPVERQQKMITDTSTSLSVPGKTTEASVFKQWIKSRTAKTTVMGRTIPYDQPDGSRYTRDTGDGDRLREVVQPSQVNTDDAKAFDDDGNTGQVTVPQELG
ncbi:hypothetical protein FPCIR_3688 [Fusarium pseudocircinatum]|uniref:Uncharacterized protein n=1 Tax=Fusarium pseudocircinatum TaxID=56676 RepID=A0A8H5PJ50_9HYPO|nr:hypothetical protein FPCIR_3688 [Fusarium pseudocircinatum]